MKVVSIKNNGIKNYTPIVKDALDELGADGGTVIFEKGEYHFYREGATVRFIPVSNNSACDKHVVFPILGMKNVKIDGGGASFVFHEVTFPFAVMDSSAVTLTNFSVDTGTSPTAYFRVERVTQDGFFLHTDREKVPYRIENGALIFNRELGERSGRDRKFSLHGISERGVQYLFTGDCKDTTENLPAPYMLTDATEENGELFFKYREGNPGAIRYKEGTEVKILLDGGRDTDVILISNSSDVLIKNIVARRGIGMGIIAQLAENVEIDGFRTDEKYHGEGVTLSADSMHFVNCSGQLEIKNCEITHTMDDAINVHGMYTRIKEVNGEELLLSIGHVEQNFFNPYKVGDVIKSLNDQSLEYSATMRVDGAIMSEDGRQITLSVSSVSGTPSAGELIELPNKMPNVHIHDNKFSHYPHLRISGAGDILIERNSFENAVAALLVKDLAKFWYESGRVKSLVFKNNTLKSCNALGGVSFITVDVDGFAHENTPKIHGRVEISSNRFEGVSQKAIVAAGVNELIIKDNSYASVGDEVIYVDGNRVK